MDVTKSSAESATEGWRFRRLFCRPSLNSGRSPRGNMQDRFAGSFRNADALSKRIVRTLEISECLDDGFRIIVATKGLRESTHKRFVFFFPHFFVSRKLRPFHSSHHCAIRGALGLIFSNSRQPSIALRLIGTISAFQPIDRGGSIFLIKAVDD